MTVDHQPAGDGNTITVRVPMTFRRFGGRKLVTAPEGGEATPTQLPEPDDPLVRALGRAFRWQRLLEDGRYSTIEDLAVAERINPSYVSRILRLTLLAPDIVEAILDGRQPEDLTLKKLTRPFPLVWSGQKDK